MATKRKTQSANKQTASKSDMKTLNELKAVTKELDTRAKTSGELFDKKFRLMAKLGIDNKGI